jgi:16S rRNA U516 pseudouridylate synthase RsuA-like enzyme
MVDLVVFPPGGGSIGICARLVRVNGQPADTVQPPTPASIDRQAERQQRQQVTILINKPVGYVSGSTEDHESAVALQCSRKTAGVECNSRTRWALSSCGHAGRAAGH